MNKVYGTMSVGMLHHLPGGLGRSPASPPRAILGAAMQFGQDQYLTGCSQAIYASPLKWLIMFAPLILVFAFGAGINRCRPPPRRRSSTPSPR